MEENVQLLTILDTKFSLCRFQKIMDPRAQNQLILKIYDAALDPRLWPNVLSEFSDKIRSFGAIVFEVDNVNGISFARALHISDRYSQAAVDYYIEKHKELEIADQNAFARNARMSDEIELISDSVLASTEAELLQRDNQQMLMDYGIRYRQGALLNKDFLSKDTFAIQYAPEAHQHLEESTAEAAIIVPHIAKALNLSRPIRALSSKISQVAHALDRLKVGICILDDKNRVVLKNAEFERQCEFSQVFQIDAKGRFHIMDPNVANDFERMRIDKSFHGRFGARPRKEALWDEANNSRRSFCVEVCPIEGNDELGLSNLSGSLIISTDCSIDYGIDTHTICEMFNLTGAEARILQMLQTGDTNKEISDRVERSSETVKKQIASILGKTNCRNRTQLVRMVTNINASNLIKSDELRI